MTTAVPPGGLSTVRNAARLLKVFRSREADLGVSELARRLGLGKSTVHRMLTTLVAEGLIEQNPRTGAAMDATPISRSLTASAQPRRRTRSSSAANWDRSVIVCGVRAVNGAARSTTCRLASGR